MKKMVSHVYFSCVDFMISVYILKSKRGKMWLIEA